MQIYHYDPQTGEYRGANEAAPNPKRPERPKVPANATTIEPPTVTDPRTALVFGGEGWTQVPDWRGETRYKKSDGEVVSFALGQEPDDTMTDAPRPTPDHVWDGAGWSVPFERAKELKSQEIAAARWNAVNGGVSFRGIQFHTDQDARLAVLEAVTGLQNKGTLASHWKGIDGVLPLDAETFMELAEAILGLKQIMFEREFTLQAQIAAASTPEEVEAIRWEI